MDSGFDGFVLGLGRVCARDDSLADIDSARLVFTKSVEGLIDEAGYGRATMDEGEVGFINFPALLLLPEQGGVLFASGHKEEAASLAVESANQGEELLGVVVA
jgi:hypothetical protein